jgi:ribulose 1,5-bisphosphate synthetase/thiazole synthase
MKRRLSSCVLQCVCHLVSHYELQSSHDDGTIRRILWCTYEDYDMNTYTDVIIIGGGPTGLSLACQLIRYGIDFVSWKRTTR